MFRISIPQGAVPGPAGVIRLAERHRRPAGRDCRRGIGRVLDAAIARPTGAYGPVLARGQTRCAAARVPCSVMRRPNYFATLGTPIVAGRDLEWADHYGTQQVAVISETFARARVGRAGRRDRQAGAPNTDGPWIEVVGVAGDVRLHGVEQSAPDAIYLVLERGPRAVRGRQHALRHPQRARRHARVFSGDRTSRLVVERQCAARQRGDARRRLRSLDGADVADARLLASRARWRSRSALSASTAS